MRSFSKSVGITVFYDKELNKITGKDKETVHINERMPFVLFLSTIFISYPAIQNKYPAGTLGFMVNGKPPLDFDQLQDKDIVKFLVIDIMTNLS